jgi:hypothetical protein
MENHRGHEVDFYGSYGIWDPLPQPCMEVSQNEERLVFL